MKYEDIVSDFKNVRKINGQRNWQHFMEKYNCEHVCELGVFKGDHFMEMIKHGPKLAVAVDSWDNKGVHSEKDASYTNDELNEQYLNFKNKVNKFTFVKIIKDYTDNASRLFPNEYFDFVYIDADHSTKECYKDITNWYPKVKTGKFLVGHDYRRGFGVVDAVNKFIKENELELIFIQPSVWAVVKK